MQSIYPNASKSNAKAVTVCPLKFEMVSSIQEFMLYYQAWEEIVLKKYFCRRSLWYSVSNIKQNNILLKWTNFFSTMKNMCVRLFS